MNRKGTLTIVGEYQQNPLNGGGSVTVSCTCGNVFKTYRSRWNQYSGKGCEKCRRTIAYSGKNNPKYRHGGNMEYRKEKNTYDAMIRRCYDINFRSYKWYGARGINVCDRWKNKETGFINFMKDMGSKPTPKHTIDRVDNDGNYTPKNCRWATAKEQANNKR